jgi:two-component system, chemotaxis family, CheB/CheR fusion protein
MKKKRPSASEPGSASAAAVRAQGADSKASAIPNSLFTAQPDPILVLPPGDLSGEQLQAEDEEAQANESAARSKPFPVVGVGASAGGLGALTELLRSLPPDTGMAFVFVQHMDPTHESGLKRLLARETAMPVIEVTDGIAVEPNHVYVIPPNREMSLSGGVLRLGNRRRGIAGNNPIDSFFNSLAQDQKGSSIGVILSGIGSDGTLGCKAIKAAGGLTFAQDEESAKFSGMPSSAFFSGCVDLQLPIHRIAEELVRAVKHPFLDGSEPAAPMIPEAGAQDGNFTKILRLLRTATNVDFAYYKPSTIRRRVARRMILNKAQDLEEYVSYLLQTPKEVQSLFEDILIHVTGFFREPEVFQALSQTVFSGFKERLSHGEKVRIWVPGCSTGEEVYSIAMTLLEQLGDSPGVSLVQIFGTDISNQNIERARVGMYSESAVSAVDSSRLKRFFVKTEEGYQISKFIRDLCIFARHDLGKDPPFSKLDMISCRNVLIYLGSSLQKRAISIFHYALSSRGVLLLGKSETIMAHSNLFELEDRQHKIYRKRDGERQYFPDLVAIGIDRPRLGSAGFTDAPLHPFDTRREAERIVLDRYAPPGMLLDDRLQILHFQGDVSSYLKPSVGQASFDLVKMIRAELVIEVRKAVEEARRTGVTQRREGLQWNIDGKTLRTDLEAVPLRESRNGFEFLVLFLQPQPVNRVPAPADLSDDPLRQELERVQEELDSARQYLRTVIEDSEASNEELRAANEEVLSSNEELQSTNEELETAKEELQSANEELTTLNEEMHNRNEDLAQLASDLSNLLAGMEIAVIILGADRTIRRYTPAAERIFNLIPGDIGRSIGNIKGNVEIPDLEQLLSEALRSRDSIIEREVQDRDGHWYSLRMRPYKVGDGDPQSAIMALVDVDSTKRASDAIVETLREPIVVLDSKFNVISANPAFYETFNLKREDVEKQNLFQISNGEWNIPALLGLLMEVLPNKTVVKNFQVESNFRGKGRRRLRVNARQLFLRGMATPMILLMIADETDHAQVAEVLRAREETLRITNAKLSSLSGELIVRTERTSRKLARDLHDAFVHDILALSLRLEELQKSSSVPPSVSKRLRTLASESRKLATGIQEFARGLHPAVLEELGLGSSLKAECASASKLYNTPVSFSQKNVPAKLPEDVAASLYRITQEALRNIAQHSRARQAKVSLEGSPSGVELTISDDGRGFAVDQGKRMGGLGLIGMEERVRLLGGWIDVESSPGEGCTIHVHIPLKRKSKTNSKNKKKASK